MNRAVKNIIGIGASAGGLSAISKLLASFDKQLDAAVFIVLHVSRNSLMPVILNQLQKECLLRCLIPEDGDPILNNCVYLAPADHQMMIEKDKIVVKKGAFENYWRPSIDVLFRSAAAAYGSCVTGIILTGLLDDGTSGMSAIKRSGGKCIVQDPDEADFPDMPKSVLENVAIDYKVPIADIGYIVSDLSSRADCDANAAPDEVKLEAQIAKRLSSDREPLDKLGTLTAFNCPECGGVLVRVAGDPVPGYRCYTGHSFTEKALENEQMMQLEDSLWVAIRLMEERKNLLSIIEGNEALKKQRLNQMEVHIRRLKKMLENIGEKPGKLE